MLCQRRERELKGRKEARAEIMLEMVKNLLAAGTPIEFIIKATWLPLMARLIGKNWFTGL